MKYSIFHTSHCGSTLLAKLLSESIETYSEPPWSMFTDMKLIFAGQDNTLVKYPSRTSLACRLIPGKKIFLYRDLQDHLEKITSKPQVLDIHLSVHYPFFKHIRNLFPDLKVNNDIEKLAFVWAQIYLDVYFSQNVLFLKANDFFLKPEESVQKVVDFFEIKLIKNFEYTKFYVKEDYLNKEEVLNNIKSKKKIPYNIKDGYIKTEKFGEMNDWVQKNIFDVLTPYEIFPLFRLQNGQPLYNFIPGETIKFSID